MRQYEGCYGNVLPAISERVGVLIKRESPGELSVERVLTEC